MLFTRCLSGARVVKKGGGKNIGGIEFKGYGSSTDDYHTAYLTAAVGVGMTRVEVEGFLKRLDKVLKEAKKKDGKRKKGKVEKADDTKAVGEVSWTHEVHCWLTLLVA